jgi:GT2 family glycosyltransferase
VSDIGVVAIGRNEGERLRRCLESIGARAATVVYVDSGSTDGSVALAQQLGVAVVELDMKVSFTAARGRNAGFDYLVEHSPGIPYVQFVDGDCEVVADWLERARQELEARPDVAAVCGRRRERYPEASVYNQICDIEWETPIGEARSCGGDALMRVQAVQEVGRYNPTVIAAEDDELCVRLRQKGWKILRIDADMTIHDAAMHRVGQWWKRAMRCGYAYALGAWMHGAPPERHFIRDRRRVIIWGALIPLIALAAAWPTWGLSLLLFLLYPLQMARIYRSARRRPLSQKAAAAWAVSCVASKVPEFCGLCKFCWVHWRGSHGQLIEYK